MIYYKILWLLFLAEMWYLESGLQIDMLLRKLYSSVQIIDVNEEK